MSTLRSLFVRALARQPRRRAAAVGVVAVLAVGVGGGLAWASIPDGSGVFHACLGTGGAVRVIDTATQTCGPSESPVSWNQQGPVGPRGPAGVGVSGPPGPSGAPGAGRVVATGAAGPLSQPAAGTGGPVFTVPFTLTTAGFVHAMGYGELELSAGAACNGGTVMANKLLLMVDGNSVDSDTGFAPVTQYGLSNSGTFGTDVWLSAGTHTLGINYDTGCDMSGTITMTNLHVEADAY